MRLWNQHAAAPAPSLADALTSASDAIDQLHAWLAPTADGAFSVADLERRLQHFVARRRRARRKRRARSQRPIATRSAALSDDSQREADELLGNQIPETIAMATLARQIVAPLRRAALAPASAAASGPLVPAADAAAFGEEWVAAYARPMPHVGTVPWFAARPGPGRDRDCFIELSSSD